MRKQHWKVISSLRTWPGPLLLPTHDPPGQHIVERGNTVGKLKERNYNSLNVYRRAEGGTERESKEVWKGRPCDILLWGIPGPGLVNSLKLVFGASDLDCCSAIKICHLVVFIKQLNSTLMYVTTHTHTHIQLPLCRYKAILPQQIIDIVDTSEEAVFF